MMKAKSLKKRHTREAIITSDSELVALVADWAAGNPSQPPVGQSVGLAESRAAELRRAVRQGDPVDLDLKDQEDVADVFHAACRSLGDECSSSPRSALADASELWKLLKESPWREDEFGEKEALLCSLAFVAWRSARILDLPSVAYRWEQNYLIGFRGSLNWDVAALACGSKDCNASADLVREPETAFQALLYLHEQRESAPRAIAVNAKAIYDLIVANGGVLPPDMEQFLLGLSARVAGNANRGLGVFEEASRWLDLAEGHFKACTDSLSQLRRVDYQRLALFYSFGRFDVIRKAAPILENDFARLGMVEDRVRCRILWSTSLKCVGECEEALEILEPVRSLRSDLSPALYGWVLMELGDIHLINGENDLGFRHLAEAAQLLRSTNQRTGWASSIMMMGFGYRYQGKPEQAIQLFRNAQEEYASLEMRPLESYARLLVAEAFLAMGHWSAAEEEARQIIPIFEKHRLLDESIAAVAVLREALRQRKLDPQTLRELRERFRSGHK